VTIPQDALVFDTGPLRHFATEGWLGILRFLAGEREIYIPESVERELNGAFDLVPAARQALDADWINVHRSTSLEYAEAFSHYHDRLVANGKNAGECGVLAMGKVYGCELVMDDATPRRIAEEEGIRVTATVPMLCDAIRARKLTTVMVEELADNLLEGSYYLPFGPGGFRQHVLENGLLDYDEL
jgi:predicted nucleic acid-binding protein